MSRSDHDDNLDENVNSVINESISSILDTCATYIETFDFAVTLFLRSLSQFRRNYLAFIEKKKCKALRKKVGEKKAKSAAKRVDMHFSMMIDPKTELYST